jgi:hypothetical protein
MWENLDWVWGFHAAIRLLRQSLVRPPRIRSSLPADTSSFFRGQGLSLRLGKWLSRYPGVKGIKALAR